MRIFLILIILTFITGNTAMEFNNDWKFKKSNLDNWENVTIPHTWNHSDMQNGSDFYSGAGIYEKRFKSNSKWKDKRVFLRFFGVGQTAKVMLNSKSVGIHKGGYSAFTLEITDYLSQEEENVLKVEVNNKNRADVVPINHNLFGVFGGIYRNVEIIVKPKVCITPLDYASSGIYIDQNEVNSNKVIFSLRAKLDNEYINDQIVTLKSELIDADGNIVKSLEEEVTLIARKRSEVSQKFTFENPKLWNGKKDPYRYQVRVSIIKDNIEIDSQSEYVGFRSFSIDPQQGFMLNGQPYRLYGVARHQDKENKGSALKLNDHLNDFSIIDEIGATTVRLAHYQQSREVYNICDSLGLIIWAEIPFVNALSLEESENVRQQLLELIRQNYNHPSICFWGLFNEIPAENYPSYASNLVSELQEIAKSEDPYRLTTSASASGDNKNPVHWKTDLQAFNRYHGWYGGDVSGFSVELDKIHAEMPDKLLGISEYGAGANVSHFSNNNVKPDPIGDFFPENYQAHFHEQHWKQIAERPYLWATYVWNMFDFACPTIDRGNRKGINHKGLVSYDRKIKKDAFYFYKSNWNPEPMIYIADKKHEYIESEKVSLKIYSNLAELQLYQNNKLITQIPEIIAPNTFVWHNLKLEEEQNKFVVKSDTLIDECYKMIKLSTPHLKFTKGNSRIFYDETEFYFDSQNTIYNLDGKDVESSGESITVNKTSTIDYYASKRGRKDSKHQKINFIKATKYDLLDYSKPDPKYPGVQNSISNLMKGSTDFHDPEWIGYEGRSASFLILPEDKVNQIRVGFLVNKDAWIVPPKSITIYGIDKHDNKVEVSKSEDFSWDIRLQEAVLKVDSGFMKYLIEVESFIDLPQWHSGYGYPCWIFLDEIICE
jgi:beta-galactosidase